jgi:outer membrane protein OmpA-like peptidoglycan-associated protein
MVGILSLLLACQHTPPAEIREEVAWVAPDCVLEIKPEAVVIDHVISFEPDGRTPDAESTAMMSKLVEILAAPDMIDHVVINGHAAAGEGAYARSVDQARAIWEDLVLAGVPPHKLCYRGLGAHDEGNHVSFDVVVVYDHDRPHQPHSVDADGVREAITGGR